MFMLHPLSQLCYHQRIVPSCNTTKALGDSIRTEQDTGIVPGPLSDFAITIVSVLILLVAGFQGASAQTLDQPVTNPGTPPQPEVTTGTSEKPEPEIGPCVASDIAGETWLDQTHDFVAQHLCEPAVWFDGFFGEYRVLEDFRPGTFVKWRSAARWTEAQDVDHVGDIGVWWNLPQFEKFLKKARIFIVSGSDTDLFTTQPGQPVNPGFDPATGIRNPTVGVRVDFFTWLRSMVSIDTGIKIQVPLGPFARMRYQYTKPFGDNYVIRLTETGLWRYTERFTETSQLDLEREISTFTLLRWRNYATVTDGMAGVTWNSGISLITELTPKSAISLDTSMWGVNHPDWTIQNYRVGSRYRRNMYRPWLFFEMEPEVTWPKEDGVPMHSVYAVTATVEIQFGR